jgi:hypothetical protein
LLRALLLVCLVSTSLSAKTITGRVVRVADGDTITILVGVIGRSEFG